MNDEDATIRTETQNRLFVAFGGVALAVIQVLLARWKPADLLSWIPIAIATVFYLFWYTDPRWWYRRKSAQCLWAATVSASMPLVVVQFKLKETITIGLASGASVVVVLSFLLFSGYFAWLDYKHHHKPPEETKNAPQQSR